MDYNILIWNELRIQILDINLFDEQEYKHWNISYIINVEKPFSAFAAYGDCSALPHS